MISPDQLHPQSRVWIYQANRAFLPQEASAINQALEQFTTQWTAHNHALKAFGKVFYHRFIVLMVDETQAAASGCSIDKSVHFLQSIEDQLGISLFDRLTLAYLDNDTVRTVHSSNLANAVIEGLLTADTPVFNNMVQTKEEWEHNWIIPLQHSWAGQLIQA